MLEHHGAEVSGRIDTDDLQKLDPNKMWNKHIHEILHEGYNCGNPQKARSVVLSACQRCPLQFPKTILLPHCFPMRDP